jgi:hypothetical protein
MEKTYDNCKRFDSLMARCPNRDNEYFFQLRIWQEQDANIDLKPSHQLFEEVNKVCAACGSFEPIKRS